jgi:hypothetical protein
VISHRQTERKLKHECDQLEEELQASNAELDAMRAAHPPASSPNRPNNTLSETVSKSSLLSELAELNQQVPSNIYADVVIFLRLACLDAHSCCTSASTPPSDLLGRCHIDSQP